jgi:hypothetical protein
MLHLDRDARGSPCVFISIFRHAEELICDRRGRAAGAERGGD